ncbi:beta-galactosidase 16 [Quercus suber]|uniref:Beta-galactosidase 16 n=1 Tax=Quercus suber TaxID=58331 RepID=A0AAW0J7T0_QUESU
MTSIDLQKIYLGGTNYVEQALQCKSQLIMIKLLLMNMLKWGQLKELHTAIKLCSTTLVQGARTNFSIRRKWRLCDISYYLCETKCYCTNSKYTTSIRKSKSIGILVDCKNITFNSVKVKTVYNDRIIKSTQHFVSISSWEEWRDVTVNFEDASLKSNELLKHTNTTKDNFDDLWYTLRFEVTLSCTKPRLHAQSFAHVAHAFLKDIYIGAANGSSNVMYFTMDIPIELNDGMKILVSNKMTGWNQYSEINSFLQQSKNSN